MEHLQIDVSSPVCGKKQPLVYRSKDEDVNTLLYPRADSAKSYATATTARTFPLFRLESLGQGSSATVHKSIMLKTLTVCAEKVMVAADPAKNIQLLRELELLKKACTNPSAFTPGGSGAAVREGKNVSNGIQDRNFGSSGAVSTRDSRQQESDDREGCPFIVNLLDVIPNPYDGTLSICLEYMDGGSLQDLVRSGGCKDEPMLASIAFQLLSGLKFLHERRLIHRDLKPSNALICSRGRVKLADFGLARVLELGSSLADSFVGTFDYMAPERLTGDSYSFSADIWSFGISIHAIAIGAYPYAKDRGYWQLMHATQEAPVPLPPRAVFSQPFVDFIAQACVKEPKMRATALGLLRDDFLCLYKIPLRDGMTVDSSLSVSTAGSTGTTSLEMKSAVAGSDDSQHSTSPKSVTNECKAQQQQTPRNRSQVDEKRKHTAAAGLKKLKISLSGADPHGGTVTHTARSSGGLSSGRASNGHNNNNNNRNTSSRTSLRGYTTLSPLRKAVRKGPRQTIDNNSPSTARSSKSDGSIDEAAVAISLSPSPSSSSSSSALRKKSVARRRTSIAAVKQLVGSASRESKGMSFLHPHTPSHSPSHSANASPSPSRMRSLTLASTPAGSSTTAAGAKTSRFSSRLRADSTTSCKQSSYSGGAVASRKPPLQPASGSANNVSSKSSITSNNSISSNSSKASGGASGGRSRPSGAANKMLSSSNSSANPTASSATAASCSALGVNSPAMGTICASKKAGIATGDLTLLSRAMGSRGLLPPPPGSAAATATALLSSALGTIPSVGSGAALGSTASLSLSVPTFPHIASIDDDGGGAMLGSSCSEADLANNPLGSKEIRRGDGEGDASTSLECAKPTKAKKSGPNDQKLPIAGARGETRNEICSPKRMGSYKIETGKFRRRMSAPAANESPSASPSVSVLRKKGIAKTAANNFTSDAGNMDGENACLSNVDERDCDGEDDVDSKEDFNAAPRKENAGRSSPETALKTRRRSSEPARTLKQSATTAALGLLAPRSSEEEEVEEEEMFEEEKDGEGDRADSREYALLNNHSSSNSERDLGNDHRNLRTAGFSDAGSVSDVQMSERLSTGIGIASREREKQPVGISFLASSTSSASGDGGRDCCGEGNGGREMEGGEARFQVNTQLPPRSAKHSLRRPSSQQRQPATRQGLIPSSKSHVTDILSLSSTTTTTTTTTTTINNNNNNNRCDLNASGNSLISLPAGIVGKKTSPPVSWETAQQLAQQWKLQILRTEFPHLFQSVKAPAIAAASFHERAALQELGFSTDNLLNAFSDRAGAPHTEKHTLATSTFSSTDAEKSRTIKETGQIIDNNTLNLSLSPFLGLEDDEKLEAFHGDVPVFGALSRPSSSDIPLAPRASSRSRMIGIGNIAATESTLSSTYALRNNDVAPQNAGRGLYLDSFSSRSALTMEDSAAGAGSSSALSMQAMLLAGAGIQINCDGGARSSVGDTSKRGEEGGRGGVGRGGREKSAEVVQVTESMLTSLATDLNCDLAVLRKAFNLAIYQLNAEFPGSVRLDRAPYLSESAMDRTASGATIASGVGDVFEKGVRDAHSWDAADALPTIGASLSSATSKSISSGSILRSASEDGVHPAASSHKLLSISVRPKSRPGVSSVDQADFTTTHADHIAEPDTNAAISPSPSPSTHPSLLHPHKSTLMTAPLSVLKEELDEDAMTSAATSGKNSGSALYRSGAGSAALSTKSIIGLLPNENSDAVCSPSHIDTLAFSSPEKLSLETSLLTYSQSLSFPQCHTRGEEGSRGPGAVEEENLSSNSPLSVSSTERDHAEEGSQHAAGYADVKVSSSTTTTSISTTKTTTTSVGVHYISGASERRIQGALRVRDVERARGGALSDDREDDKDALYMFPIDGETSVHCFDASMDLPSETAHPRKRHGGEGSDGVGAVAGSTKCRLLVRSFLQESEWTESEKIGFSNAFGLTTFVPSSMSDSCNSFALHCVQSSHSSRSSHSSSFLTATATHTNPSSGRAKDEGITGGSGSFLGVEKGFCSTTGLISSSSNNRAISHSASDQSLPLITEQSALRNSSNHINHTRTSATATTGTGSANERLGVGNSATVDSDSFSLSYSPSSSEQQHRNALTANERDHSQVGGSLSNKSSPYGALTPSSPQGAPQDPDQLALFVSSSNGSSSPSGTPSFSPPSNRGTFNPHTPVTHKLPQQLLHRKASSSFYKLSLLNSGKERRKDADERSPPYNASAAMTGGNSCDSLRRDETTTLTVVTTERGTKTEERNETKIEGMVITDAANGQTLNPATASSVEWQHRTLTKITNTRSTTHKEKFPVSGDSSCDRVTKPPTHRSERFDLGGDTAAAAAVAHQGSMRMDPYKDTDFGAALEVDTEGEGEERAQEREGEREWEGEIEIEEEIASIYSSPHCLDGGSDGVDSSFESILTAMAPHDPDALSDSNSLDRAAAAGGGSPSPVRSANINIDIQNNVGVGVGMDAIHSGRNLVNGKSVYAHDAGPFYARSYCSLRADRDNKGGGARGVCAANAHSDANDVDRDAVAVDVRRDRSDGYAAGEDCALTPRDSARRYSSDNLSGSIHAEDDELDERLEHLDEIRTESGGAPFKDEERVQGKQYDDSGRCVSDLVKRRGVAQLCGEFAAEVDGVDLATLGMFIADPVASPTCRDEREQPKQSPAMQPAVSVAVDERRAGEQTVRSSGSASSGAKKERNGPSSFTPSSNAMDDKELTGMRLTNSTTVSSRSSHSHSGHNLCSIRTMRAMHAMHSSISSSNSSSNHSLMQLQRDSIANSHNAHLSRQHDTPALYGAAAAASASVSVSNSGFGSGSASSRSVQTSSTCNAAFLQNKSGSQSTIPSIASSIDSRASSLRTYVTNTNSDRTLSDPKYSQNDGIYGGFGGIGSIGNSGSGEFQAARNARNSCTTQNRQFSFGAHLQQEVSGPLGNNCSVDEDLRVGGMRGEQRGEGVSYSSFSSYSTVQLQPLSRLQQQQEQLQLQGQRTIGRIDELVEVDEEWGKDFASSTTTTKTTTTVGAGAVLAEGDETSAGEHLQRNRGIPRRGEGFHREFGVVGGEFFELGSQNQSQKEYAPKESPLLTPTQLPREVLQRGEGEREGKMNAMEGERETERGREKMTQHLLQPFLSSPSLSSDHYSCSDDAFEELDSEAAGDSGKHTGFVLSPTT